MRTTTTRMMFALLVLFSFSGITLSAQTFDARTLPGQFIPPGNISVGTIITRAIEHRGGPGRWSKIRQLTFTQRYQVKSPEGQLIYRGLTEKTMLKDGNQFFSRSDDQSEATPAFIRALGPDGMWITRAAKRVHDDMLNRAYLFEATRDYLLLSLPELLKRRGTVTSYAGTKPVHGEKCYQIYVKEIKALKAFEGYEYLLSISANDFSIKALSFWKEQTSQRKTTIFPSQERTVKIPGRNLTINIPTHFFIIFPDSSTLSLTNTSFAVNEHITKERFLLPPGIQTGYPHSRKRQRDYGSKEMLVRYYPRTTFLVDPENRHYYLMMKGRETSR